MNKVPLNLEGLDGNAFRLLSVFKRAALKSGWTASEVEDVFKEAKSQDYDYLISTIAGHCEPPNQNTP